MYNTINKSLYQTTAQWNHVFLPIKISINTTRTCIPQLLAQILVKKSIDSEISLQNQSITFAVALTSGEILLVVRPIW